MNTKALNELAALICRAQEQDRTPMGIAFAVDAAGRHMSPEVAAEMAALKAQVAELEAQRERRRVRLVALQNDALSMRGSLSPMGEGRKVPFPLGETLTPAVDWLIARVAELEDVLRLRSTQRGDVGRLIEVAGQSGEDCIDVDELRVALSLDADDVGVEPVGEFYTTVHHAYRPGLGRDLPETGGTK